MPAPFRLLCALLALLLVLPALQANACAPVVQTSGLAADPDLHHGHGMHGEMGAGDSLEHGRGFPEQPASSPVGRHDCIGCVAPLDTRAFRPVSRLEFHDQQRLWALTYTSLSEWLGTPEPPPPRHSA